MKKPTAWCAGSIASTGGRRRECEPAATARLIELNGGLVEPV